MLAPAYVTTPDVWKLVNVFDTLEAAEAVVDKLKATGAEADVTLVGGLSVIARNRKVAPHIIRCHPHQRMPTHNWVDSECGVLDIRETPPNEAIGVL